MPNRRPSGQPAAAGVTFLAGVAIGTVVVLAFAASFAAPFRLGLSPARSAELAELGCTTNHCINVTIEFTGVSSLDPGRLRVAVVPFNDTEIVNGSSGTPLHLTYFPAQEPRWTGNLGSGHYGGEFGGDVVDPHAQLVGSGGPSTVVSGAVLCLRSNATGPILEYYLTVGYDSESVTIPFALA